MEIIKVRNVNEALLVGIELIKQKGVPLTSRYGDTLEVPSPVTTIYQHPHQRVLMNPLRDANPFFHLFESLWILAGRQDVKFLSEFNSRMVEFSDDGKVFNAAYGYRLKNYFNDAGNCDFDQITEVIRTLESSPDSRQAICQIWDPIDLDMTVKTKDKACNLCVVFRIRDSQLDMTVYNRSNDMIWGAYGANVVQFSMIQEYVAAKLNISMGTYYQVSNSFHIYTTGPGGEAWNKLKSDYKCNYDYTAMKDSDLVLMKPKDMGNFDIDLTRFFSYYDLSGLDRILNGSFKSSYFKDLVIPMLECYSIYKANGPALAYKHISDIKAKDWWVACGQWLNNRTRSKK